jgi:uncharacterized protein YeaO (DUF488 family)
LGAGGGGAVDETNPVMRIAIKRVYEPAARQDGVRVLVDRLWPRGLSKQRARIDLWLRDVAPSTALRKWFNHDPSRWQTFCARYREELLGKTDLLDSLQQHAKHDRVTLLYGARDKKFNQAVALKIFLERRAKQRSPGRSSQ